MTIIYSKLSKIFLETSGIFPFFDPTRCRKGGKTWKARIPRKIAFLAKVRQMPQKIRN